MHKDSSQIKNLFAALFFVAAFAFSAQNTGLSAQVNNTLLAKLTEGDSLVYYQCHVESAEQELRTASGHTLNSISKNLSITEKYVLYKQNGNYRLTHFVSVLTMCPNRRFSGLKFKEKPYWEFFYKETKQLSELDIKSLEGIENVGKEANEYDFAITTKNRNQVIILGGKTAKQLGLPDAFLVSKLFK